jgi:diguanylate cyclase (GGDEF)-like protein
VADEHTPEDGPGAVSERREGADAFTRSSDVSRAMAASPDLNEMLSAVARRAAEALDVLARRGGEEPPPPGHRDGAGQVAERIRARVAGALFPGVDGPMLPALTVSMGVAMFPVHTASPEDLVGHADAALYAARRAGKDRVETHG